MTQDARAPQSIPDLQAAIQEAQDIKLPFPKARAAAALARSAAAGLTAIAQEIEDAHTLLDTLVRERNAIAALEKVRRTRLLAQWITRLRT